MALKLVIIVLSLLQSFRTEWGFFGHRRINRMATFTLPPEMMVLYRPNIDYLTEHAVDPDKRRYATKHEAVRHYIDIDHWGEYPFDDIPTSLISAKDFDDSSSHSIKNDVDKKELSLKSFVTLEHQQHNENGKNQESRVKLCQMTLENATLH